MWLNETVSVVLMTYAEKDSIRDVIQEFFDTGVVDEVIVVNNNAEEGTSEQVAMTEAREVLEPRQGYGYATRRGLQEAVGDLVVIAEPDGTFSGRDIFKLLSYSRDCDAVFGTRTYQTLIWEGANMGHFLRIGNWAVASYVRLIFGSEYLSDVGCSYRLLRHHVIDQILDKLEIGGSQLGPELMLRTLLTGARVVEVPVNYLPRVGVSSVTGDSRKAVILGLQMIGLITMIRMRTLGKTCRPARMSHRELPARSLISPYPIREIADVSEIVN
ncbi:glycosyltransferase family 2 protein [Cryobacterium sp. Y82]|uniref:glycosyltransferase family 2 protein n=1 Tax=Cryobacterium sp. Y82 TaxID=2045017 RepID=UPI000CE4B6D0|nr:glycosyltransferase family 2 protein [Cryobacterium sp. Y82]